MDPILKAKFPDDAFGEHLLKHLGFVESAAAQMVHAEGDLDTLARKAFQKHEIRVPRLVMDDAWVEYLKAGGNAAHGVILDDTIVFHFPYTGGMAIVTAARSGMREETWPWDARLSETEIQVHRKHKFDFGVTDYAPDAEMALAEGQRMLAEAIDIAERILQPVADRAAEIELFATEARALVEAIRLKTEAFRNYGLRFREGIGLPTQAKATVTELDPSKPRAISA